MLIAVSFAGAGEPAASGAGDRGGHEQPKQDETNTEARRMPCCSAPRFATGTPPDNMRERNRLTVQRQLWTRDYSPQPAENIDVVPQYFALALADLIVETADGVVGAGAGPDLGQRVELSPNLFGLRGDFDLRFGGAVGHSLESARSFTSLNPGPSGLGKTRTGLDRDASPSRTIWVSVG